jgi:N-formylglutamate amidohydrolase
MARRFALLIAVLVPSAVWGQDKPDLEKYVTMKPGTLPIILSAPHGGDLRLPDIPDRKGEGVKQFVTARDTGTTQLAEKLAAAIEKAMGGKPYLVVARFERKQLDPNRPAEGSFEAATAKPYYDAYHGALKGYCEAVRKTWGRGLLLDLHGQGAKADVIFRGTQNLKTVSALKDRFGMAAVTGPDSVFGVLAKKGYGVFPPLDEPGVKEDPRYNGGYIVRTYGSDAGTGVDAIQLEFGGAHRSAKALDRTAADVADGVAAFARAYLPAEKLPK